MHTRAGSMIAQIKQISGRIFERILCEKNIEAFNGAQGHILYVLWQQDNLTLSELAERSGLAATTLTSMIDRMEAAGLVRRVPDKEDRRKTRLVLTGQAKALEGDYNEVSEQMSRVFYRGFSQEERAQLERYLERILRNLKDSQ